MRRKHTSVRFFRYASSYVPVIFSGTRRSIRNWTRKMFMPLPTRVLMVAGSGKMYSVP